MSVGFCMMQNTPVPDLRRHDMTQTSHSTFEPQELALLQRCYAGASIQRRLLGDADEANRLAAQIFQLYRDGVRDETELRARLSGRMPQAH
jgi:hypothetical protein